MLPRISLFAALVAGVLLIVSARADDSDPKDGEPKEYEGMVESAGDDKITVKIGDEEFSFSVNDQTSIKFEGEDAELEDIMDGHFAKITATKNDDELVATIIDARAAQ